MIRHKLGRLVQWMEGDAHMVGQVVVEGGTNDIPLCDFELGVLVALAHTHELVSVEANKLSDYPASKIPEPTK